MVRKDVANGSAEVIAIRLRSSELVPDKPARL